MEVGHHVGGAGHAQPPGDHQGSRIAVHAGSGTLNRDIAHGIRVALNAHAPRDDQGARITVHAGAGILQVHDPAHVDIASDTGPAVDGQGPVSDPATVEQIGDRHGASDGGIQPDADPARHDQGSRIDPIAFTGIGDSHDAPGPHVEVSPDARAPRHRERPRRGIVARARVLQVQDPGQVHVARRGQRPHPRRARGNEGPPDRHAASRVEVARQADATQDDDRPRTGARGGDPGGHVDRFSNTHASAHNKGIVVHGIITFGAAGGERVGKGGGGVLTDGRPGVGQRILHIDGPGDKRVAADINIVIQSDAAVHDQGTGVDRRRRYAPLNDHAVADVDRVVEERFARHRQNARNGVICTHGIQGNLANHRIHTVVDHRRPVDRIWRGENDVHVPAVVGFLADQDPFLGRALPQYVLDALDLAALRENPETVDIGPRESVQRNR